MTSLEFGTVIGLDSVSVALERGKAAEDAGFDRLGVPDTKPLTFQACYPAMTALLLRTRAHEDRPRMSATSSRATGPSMPRAPGPSMTSPPIGSSSASAPATAQSTTLGLPSARLAQMEESMRSLRPMLPPGAPVRMAFSGPRGMEVAGRHADEVTIGTGLDVGALRELAGRARRARDSRRHHAASDLGPDHDLSGRYAGGSRNDAQCPGRHRGASCPLQLRSLLRG